MHYACYNGHERVAFLLLDNGADMNILNSFNENVIESARQGKHFDFALRLQSNISSTCDHRKVHTCVGISREDAMLYQLHINNDNMKTNSMDDNFSTDNKSESHVQVFDLLKPGHDNATGNQSTTTNHNHPTKKRRHHNDIRIGRSRDNDIILNHMSISKHHAVISYFDNVGFFVRDLDSKHGTYLNDRRVTVADGCPVPVGGHKDIDTIANSALKDGTQLRFGHVKCHVYKRTHYHETVEGTDTVADISEEDNKMNDYNDAIRRKHLLEEITEQREFREQSNRLQQLQWKEYTKACKEMIDQAPPLTFSKQTEDSLRIKKRYLSDIIDRDFIDDYSSHQNQHDSNMNESLGGQLLQRLGWDVGKALGKSGEDADQPIQVIKRIPRAGLGSHYS
jgi:pSer/pThr/pTyr-binding forkhead associated (FHA) protein